MSRHGRGTHGPSSATNSLASRREAFADLLRRHGVDVARLRSGRGKVRCILPGHDDTTPSLSLDLERCLFNCFGCGRGGGLKALRELLGETPMALGPVSRPESDIQMARREAMQQELRTRERRTEWAPWECLNAYIRRSDVAVTAARGVATELGPNDARTWPLLELTAAVEREALALEAELDTLAVGRLA